MLVASIGVNLIFLSEPKREPVHVHLAVIPSVGDFFETPYGKGRRYRVTAVVHEADESMSAVHVEMQAV